MSENKKMKEENKDEIIVQENNEELNLEKLEKIEEEIKKQTTIPEEKKDKINKRVFQNIMIAIGIVIYFTFINLGFYNIAPAKFLIDVQAFSMLSIGITIVIYEVAYKKDSGKLAIYGIEIVIFFNGIKRHTVDIVVCIIDHHLVPGFVNNCCKRKQSLM